MPGHIAGLMPRFISCGLILFAGLLGLGGCGGYNAPSQPPPTPSFVIISPTNASVKAGTGTQNFTATVMNDYLSRGVTWALSGAGCSGATCGSLSNMTSSSAAYNAPSAGLRNRNARPPFFLGRRARPVHDGNLLRRIQPFHREATSCGLSSGTGGRFSCSPTASVCRDHSSGRAERTD